MPRLFGWKKDKYDKRAYLHKRTMAAIPDIVSMWVPQVRDQGTQNSCVGFGIGANLTGMAKQKGVYQEWSCVNWIYNGARFIDGSLGEDVGAYPKDAFDWLRWKGCLLEHFWPYNPWAFDKTSPPSRFDVEAAKWPLLEYYRITGGVDSICDALAAGYYVSIGTPWYGKWMDPGPSGLLAQLTSDDNAEYGHETCYFGYSKPDQVFYGINSWSPEWGRAGLYSMPFQAIGYFGNSGGYDAHYAVVDWVDIEPPGNLRIIVN